MIIQILVKKIPKRKASQYKNSQSNQYTRKVFIKEYHQQIEIDLEKE